MATKFIWTIPTTNVDGTAITAGEITGYRIGIRPATGTAGTYPTLVSVSDPAATSEPFSALATPMAPGNYAAAIMSVGPTNSAWSSEISFAVAAPAPNPPSGFGVA